MTDRPVRPGTPLCVVTLTYTAPIEAVDEAMPRHVAWLKQGFEAGLIVVCGRQVPRTGGVIVMRGGRASVEAIAATDPFVTEGLATAQVTAFTASMAAPALADYLA